MPCSAIRMRGRICLRHFADAVRELFPAPRVAGRIHCSAGERVERSVESGSRGTRLLPDEEDQLQVTLVGALLAAVAIEEARALDSGPKHQTEPKRVTKQRSTKSSEAEMVAEGRVDQVTPRWPRPRAKDASRLAQRIRRTDWAPLHAPRLVNLSLCSDECCHRRRSQHISGRQHTR